MRIAGIPFYMLLQQYEMNEDEGPVVLGFENVKIWKKIMCLDYFYILIFFKKNIILIYF